jgi:hypothetical protein
MNANAKFQNLTLVENGIILRLKNNQEKEIPFSELNRIYLKVYKLNPLKEFLFISIPILFVFLFVFMYSAIDVVVNVAFFVFILIFVKVKTHKKYGLNICLKNGIFFRKNVSLRSKDKEVNNLNEIKKAIKNYKNNNIP